MKNYRIRVNILNVSKEGPPCRRRTAIRRYEKSLIKEVESMRKLNEARSGEPFDLVSRVPKPKHGFATPEDIRARQEFERKRFKDLALSSNPLTSEMLRYGRKRGIG